MLVICEDCAKKYSIDEQRINAPKVRFKCRACGHIIIVEKPTGSEKKDSAVLNTQVSSVQQKTPDHGRKEEDQQGQKKQAAKEPAIESSRRAQALLRHSATGTSKGVPFFVYLLAIILFGLMVISIIFVHFSLHTIPEVLQHQLELRSRILSDSLKGTITVPLSRKDYLTVNREVQRASTLPGVAYVAVGNKKGVVIAGFFNDLKGFDRNFAQLIKEKGFPTDILNKNKISLSEEETGAEISIGGISLYDWASALPDLDGELHVGLYVDRFDKYFFK
ncbi:MAG: hypothetical protein D3909_14875, partial [Candidatus Electrothrix sp. ATG1]|nr:hypothetical protein [Candidatus Electrothrix sp. ATG1]